MNKNDNKKMQNNIKISKKYESIKPKTKWDKNSIQAFFMILPQTLGFVIFTLLPILYILRYCFFEYDGITSKFIGFENFTRAFTRDIYYWQSLINTFIFSFGKLIIEIPLALAIAAIVNLNIRGRDIFRVVYFMPNVISTAIVGLIFYFLFSPFEGLVNNVLLSLKFISEPINWFGDKWHAMFVLMVASVWQHFGMNMILFLAGLQSIPKELYECSSIDGATGIKKFFYITLPMLLPVAQVVFMLAMIGAMTMTDLVLVLTNGQPAGSTEVAMTYVYKKFFGAAEGNAIPEIGYASSLAVITAIVIGIITFLYMRLTRKVNEIY